MRARTVALLLSFVASSVVGQQASLPLANHPVRASSGVRQNTGSSAIETVWTETISVASATSIQLQFQGIQLGDERDALVVTSRWDGQQQALTSSNLKFWANHSAWFNGSAVTVELRLAPGSSGYALVDSAWFMGSIAMVPESLCAGDNRALYTDARICRLIASAGQTAGGCTGFLGAASSTIFSAGSCVGSQFTIAEFSCPASTAGGLIVHPPVSEQFPVDASTVHSNNGAAGANWAVARLHPNSTGQTAAGLHGVFTLLPLAQPYPANGAALTVAGFGTDTTPDATRNYVLQSAAGTVQAPITSNLITHDADTATGGEGSPILVGTTVVGVNTHGGCTAFPGLGNNAGTGIQEGALQSAFSSIKGCATTSLAANTPQALTCSPTVFSFVPNASQWNVVGVGGTTDWDVEIGTASSSRNGTQSDFVFVDGRAGALAPISGVATDIGAFANGTIHFASESATVVDDAPASFTWSSTAALRVFAVNVTSAGLHDVLVAGDPTLQYSLYAPNGTTAWRSRGTETPLSAGNLGGAPVGVTMGLGVHLLVISRAGGPGTPSNPTFTIHVCHHATVSPALNGTPVNVNACAQVSLPSSAGWNVVSVSTPATANWNVCFDSAQSLRTGSATDFVIARGVPSLVSGMVWRQSGSASGAVEYQSDVALTLGAPTPVSFPAGSSVRVLSFQAAVAGNYDISFPTGSASLKWRLFDHGTIGQWRSSDDATASGTLSAFPTTVSLVSGINALVIFGEPGPLAVGTTCTVRVCATPVPVTLTQGVGTPLAPICADLTHTPEGGFWNAIAVVPDSVGAADLYVGTTAAVQPGFGQCELVVANGHVGTVPAVNALAVRTSVLGTMAAEHAARLTLASATPLADSFAATDVVRIYEFPVTVAATHQITVSGAPALRWAAFDSNTGAGWVTRATAVASGTGDGVSVGATFTIGTAAIAVFREPNASTPVTFAVTCGPPAQPAPTVTSISPTLVQVGTNGITVTANGSGMTQFSTLFVDGTPFPTTFISAASVSAPYGAALLQVPGFHTVTVVNPPPGGGTSSQLTFAVNAIAPSLTAATCGAVLGTAGTVTATGANFVPGLTILRWAGTDLATTVISPTQMTAVLPASVNILGGTVSVRAFTPPPGGGQSATFPVLNPAPAPTITSVSPTSLLAGSPTTQFTITGTGFFQGASGLTVTGSGLSPTVVNSTLIQVNVPASLLAQAGNKTVIVTNAAPGGGQSNTVGFTVFNALPTIASVTPSSATVGDAPTTITVVGTGFVALTSLKIDGTGINLGVVSPTQMHGLIPAGFLAAPGVHSLTVNNPPPGGGTSASVPFVVNAPAPAITSATPTSFAFGGAQTAITLNCTNLLVGATATWNGTPLSGFVTSPGVYTGIVPSTLLGQPGPATVVIANPAPALGPSAPVTVVVEKPRIQSLSIPGIPILTPASPPQAIGITGSFFASTTRVFADGTLLPTTPISPTQLTASVPASVLGTQRPGALAITVQTFVGATKAQSNSHALLVGGFSNQGTFQLVPVDAGPGDFATFRFEGTAPGVPITVLADLTGPAPLAPFPDPATNQVLGVWQSILPVIDGIGLLGPPLPVTTVFDPDATAPGGVFEIPNLQVPNPPLGISAVLQAVVPDPSTPIGLRLTWARFPLAL